MGFFFTIKYWNDHRNGQNNYTEVGCIEGVSALLLIWCELFYF